MPFDFSAECWSVLGQWKDNKPYAICYGSWTLDEAQVNFATTKEEFLEVVFALENFRPYLIISKMIIFTNHATLKHLLKKYNSKPCLIWWVLLHQEFDLEVQNKDGHKHSIIDHLSRLGPKATLIEGLPIDDSFQITNSLLSLTKPLHGMLIWWISRCMK